MDKEKSYACNVWTARRAPPLMKDLDSWRWIGGNGQSPPATKTMLAAAGGMGLVLRLEQAM
jgi:hypothetical protein